MPQQAPALEYPNQEYFPRWKVRLIIRFAEFGKLTQLQKKVPPRPTRSLSGVDTARGNLTVTKDPASPPAGNQRWLLVAPGTQTTFGPPQAQPKSSDGLTQVIEGIVPRGFKWSQNGVRTADTLGLEVPFLSCPIDPRTCRSVAVEFFLGTVTAGQAALQNMGASGPGTGSFDLGAESVDLLPDTYTDDQGRPRTNVRFRGWVDAWSVEWGRDDEPVIHLECTDNTALLINMPAPSKAVVSKDLPLDQAIAKYLTFSPSFAGLSVEYRPANETPPTLKDVLHKSAFRPGMGPPVARMGSPSTAAEKISVWDYLTDICRSVGHSIFVDDTAVVIQRVRTLTSANVQGRLDDPYQGRTLPDGTQMPVRRLIYGRNVKEMRLKRNFTKHAPANVSVRAYNPEKKQVLVERFPLTADKQVYALPGDTTPDQKWLEFNLGGGVVDAATMRRFAQEIYEHLGRQEIAWEMKTDNFASFGGGNTDPDLLDMRAGDPLEILVARDDSRSTPGRVEGDLAAFSRNVQYMQRLGFDGEFASAYARAYTDAGFPTVYRTRQVVVSGSVEQGEGVSFDVECVNYLEVTSDKSLDGDEEPPAKAPARAPRPPASGPPSSGLPPLPAGP